MTPARTSPEPDHEIAHPATYTASIRTQLARILKAHGLPAPLLDGMAGTGLIFDIAKEAGYRAGQVFATELEPEWAVMHPKTRVADARDLPFRRDRFGALCVSSGYGNRMSDTYDGRDGSDRNTYRIGLGRQLTEGNGCAVHWGPRYRAIHSEAWEEAWRVLKPGGLFVLNVKDHLSTEKGKLVRHHVASWHLSTLLGLGFVFLEGHTVKTPGQRQGANRHRVDGEQIFVTQKPEVG